MNLFKSLYSYLTDPIIAESEKQHKTKDKEINDKYLSGSNGKHRSKWDHSRLSRDLKRNNEQHELNLNHKLAKYNWLKRLT